MEVINTDAGIAKEQDPAEVAATLKKADEGLNASGSTGESLLAGKYKTPEDLYKGIMHALPKAGGIELAVELYRQLESRIGTPPDKRGEIKLPESSPLKPEGEPTQKEGAPKPIDYQAIGQEFAEKGELSPETYKALADSGIPKPLVDTYLAGIKAVQEEIVSIAGGPEVYQEILAWGAETYSEAERDAFDRAITEGSPAERAAAVQTLKARYVQAKGPIGGVRPQFGSGVDNPMGLRPFRSYHELVAAQNDPRYGKDPAYEQELLNRLAISKI